MSDKIHDVLPCIIWSLLDCDSVSACGVLASKSDAFRRCTFGEICEIIAKSTSQSELIKKRCMTTCVGTCQWASKSARMRRPARVQWPCTYRTYKEMMYDNWRWYLSVGLQVCSDTEARDSPMPVVIHRFFISSICARLHTSLALHIQGWRPCNHKVVCTRDSAKRVDMWNAMSSRLYLRCLLDADRLFTSGLQQIPSRQRQGFYILALRHPANALPNLSAKQ